MASVTDRIVVLPMDGSYHSEYAYKWYCDQIKRDEDYVIIVAIFDRHAYGIVPFGTADANELATQMQRDIDAHQKEVDAFKEMLTKSGIKGEVVALAGKAGETTIKIAHERNAAMIVCGARGHGTVRRTIMGSNSEYIIHHSDIPVIVCRHKAHQNPTSEHKK